MRRILFYLFSFFHYCSLGFLYCCTPFLKKSRSAKGIAALPYYPATWPGGKDRIAAWKPYFDKDGIQFDVFPCWTDEDILNFFKYSKEQNEFGRYKIYFRIYRSRIKLLWKLKRYESIWIQRAYVPMFPFKDAYYEKLLSRIHPNVIYDFYDADYESNHTLVFNTVKCASKVTVASRFLESKFKAQNTEVHFIRYAIDVSGFKDHLPYRKSGNARIGWMGSPENAKQLLKIADQLQQIETDFPDVQFSFVCRDLPELGLKNKEILKWGDPGFEYYTWLSGLDIGLVPFIDESDRTKAKISMKSLEFMAAGVGQVSSPWVHSDVMRSGGTILIAEADEWYVKIRYLIENEESGKQYGETSKELYYSFHDFSVVFHSLKDVLINSEA